MGFLRRKWKRLPIGDKIFIVLMLAAFLASLGCILLRDENSFEEATEVEECLSLD